MKKLLFLLLCLLSFVFVGCKDTPDEPEEPDTPPVVEGYKDPSHKKGTYKIEFQLYGRSVVHFYEAGEMPEPPTVDEVRDDIYLYTFTGWDRTPEAVSKNAIYIAKYDQSIYQYTATFLVAGGRSIKVKTDAGTVATPPPTPDFQGMQFACWDVEPYAATDDVTYTAIYTDVTSVEGMKIAWAEGIYKTDFHAFRDLQAMTSIYTLVLQEYKNPQAHGLIAKRVIDHLTSFVDDGYAMPFDCSVNWNYGVTAATIALAKQTPTVWKNLSLSTKTRIDTLMEALAYICSFGTSDANDYRTGPSLGGNYRKTWNPNYQLGSIPVITFVTYYFGEGNLQKGAEKVNGKIRTFDEARYNDMIKKFTTYGWDRALEVWTTDGREKNGEVSTTKAMEILVYGGTAKHLNVSGSGFESSSGKGVNNGFNDYFYKGIPLERADEILREIVKFNYSGGTVKNEHWYDGNRVAWILDGTPSPYYGREGMMLEFASGNRSSTVYCDHDFTIVVLLLSAARNLYLYDEKGKEVQVDSFGEKVALYDCTKDTELWEMIQVGTEDFIYKLIHGYQCYSTGSYGEAADRHGEGDSSRGYWSMKYLWRTELLPLGTVDPAQ